MISIHVDVSEVLALGDELQANAGKVLPKAGAAVAKNGFRVVQAAQTLAPVDTGALKSSIGADIDGLSYEAGPTAEYGAYVELGTSGPYPIRNPWGWGDDVVVMHPGNAPEPYLAPAFDATFPSLIDELGDIGERIL